MLLIPALKRQGQRDLYEFEVSMIYIMRPRLKNNNINKNKQKKPKTSALIAKENMSQSLGTTIGLLCPHQNPYFCEPKRFSLHCHIGLEFTGLGDPPALAS